MPVVRVTLGVALGCAIAVAGCRDTPANCPVATLDADPPEIPDGLSETTLTVHVRDPLEESETYHVITEITKTSGSIDDPFALVTTYACAPDISGDVEICVNAKYRTGDDDGGDGSEVTGVSGMREYIQPSHIRIQDPLECSRTECITVRCPEERNECPVVSSLTVEPSPVPEGGTATITVVADDPDNNPDPLMTLLTARHGTIGDASAMVTTYACDPNVGGAIEICVLASDGDSTCDEETCTTVRCPGDPPVNTCPIIESLTADPSTIPAGETMTSIVVVADDPDDFPVLLRTELSSPTGVFEDRFASETTFTCGASGNVKICVKANDGDPACNVTTCETVRCPNEGIPVNLCPQLFVANAVQSTVPDGENDDFTACDNVADGFARCFGPADCPNGTCDVLCPGRRCTRFETRGQDNDGLPSPLTLTLNALWGSFERTDNIEQNNNVVVQNATYICDRPGRVEICVDATDGACTKTLCDNVLCPDTIPPP